MFEARPDHVQTWDAALERAVAGQLTVVVVEGDPGTGKPILLDELTARADGFQVLVAEGAATAERSPYGVLAQWGVDVHASDGSVQVPITTAARLVTAMLDEREAQGPVLLRLDELQWSDAESIAALTWVLRRSTADPVLVAVGSEPLSTGAHAAWQRWVESSDCVRRIQLAGLTFDETKALAREMQPSLRESAVRRLWEHTSGSPVYLKALLSEHEAADLMQMRVLPAPQEYAANITARIAQLPGASRDLLNAVAVLGTGWIALLDAAAVARVDHPGEAAQPLLDAELLLSREMVVGTSVRLAHPFVRSAVYQHIPLPARRQLHTRAAAMVTQADDVFEHRIAAAEGYDDALADELEQWAALLHAVLTHRLEARYLLAASALSSSPGRRQERWLDSLFASALGQDLATVRAELAAVEQADDYVRRDLVLGVAHLFTMNYHEAIYWFEKQANQVDPAHVADDATMYRIQILLAWARIQAGEPLSAIESALIAAAGLEPKDSALEVWEAVCRGVLALRTRSARDQLDDFADLPDNPAAIPWALRSRLLWRSVLYTYLGLHQRAIADFTHLFTLVEEGPLESTRPPLVVHLATMHWLAGDWQRAGLNFRLARDLAGPVVGLTSSVLSPLLAIGLGDLQRADELIGGAEQMLVDCPWVEMRDWLDITRVVRLHAAEPHHRRDSRLYDGMRSELRAAAAGEVVKTSLWLAHCALAATWANELGDAETAIHLLMTTTVAETSWAGAMVQWLYGLVAEARGKGALARTHLRAAIEDSHNDLPFYRAHMLADYARIVHVLGDPVSAELARTEATEIYTRLGAPAYVDRVAAERKARAATSVSTTQTVLLTEREQDVLTLVTSGMSYAQIARDLFVTRSTVNYHLSNIYRKAQVGSRHDLTELYRKEPLSFGVIAG